MACHLRVLFLRPWVQKHKGAFPKTLEQTSVFCLFGSNYTGRPFLRTSKHPVFLILRVASRFPSQKDAHQIPGRIVWVVWMDSSFNISVTMVSSSGQFAWSVCIFPLSMRPYQLSWPPPSLLLPSVGGPPLRFLCSSSPVSHCTLQVVTNMSTVVLQFFLSSGPILRVCTTIKLPKQNQ